MTIPSPYCGAIASARWCCPLIRWTTPASTGRRWWWPWPTRGVGRRKKLLAKLGKDTLILKATGVELPETGATVKEIDFKAQKIKSQDWALASLALVAKDERIISLEMLKAALELRFNKTVFESALSLVEKVTA